jgi:hypothetical protein
MSTSSKRREVREIPREPTYEEIFGIVPAGSPVPGGVSIQGGSNPPGGLSAQVRMRLQGQHQPQQQEQVKTETEEEKPIAQQSPPVAKVFPRGDFKARQDSTPSFERVVLGLPMYAPTGGVKLVIQRSRYFPTPDKADDAWSAVVFTYSEASYGNTKVIAPEPHVITCRNLATCIREGLLALYKYSNKQNLELLAKSGMNFAKIYKDTLLLPVCVGNTDKMCMNTDILVLDPDWPGGFIRIKSTGAEIQVRAVPAREYELFIQAGEKPVFHKYTLALTPHGTYVVTWEKMDVT